MTPCSRNGFTLVELALVLVIIGLLVGGVMVGRDLVESATMRSQAAQIETYNQAVNTFRGKYNCLPGDCTQAADFGFIPRGAYAGEGDGNNVLEGAWNNSAGANRVDFDGAGETVVFWVDLSAANLIQGGFNAANSTTNFGNSNNVMGSAVNAYLPAAKLGPSYAVYVYGYNWSNYFGLAGAVSLQLGGWVVSSPLIPVAQAWAIDQKTDDGLPASGKVTARYLSHYFMSNTPAWTTPTGAGGTAATAGSALTCYDNKNVAGAVQQYSVGQNGGTGQNCALSFQFQ